ncbi:MAG: hypothetical protein ABIE70_12860 [bacterium]
MELATGAQSFGEYVFYAITALVLTFGVVAVGLRGSARRGAPHLLCLLATPFLFGWHLYLLYVSPAPGSSFAVHVHGLGVADWIVGYAAVAAAVVVAISGAVDWILNRRRDAVVQAGFAATVVLLLIAGGRSWAPEFLAGLVLVLTLALTHYQLAESERIQ